MKQDWLQITLKKTNERHVKVDDTTSSPPWRFGNFPLYNVEKKVPCPPGAYHLPVDEKNIHIRQMTS